MDVHQLTTKVMEHEAALAAHKEELKTLFTQQKNFEKMVKSIQEMAEALQLMNVRVNSIDERLDTMEGEKSRRRFALWQILLSALAGGAVTYIITYLI
jgi:hypothetical protein|nr:MAG TPA: hemolysin [Caudoviricetes sp.]DAS99370.1 MAG TPA: hemolysin [Caudoviricetes sp.]